MRNAYSVQFTDPNVVNREEECKRLKEEALKIYSKLKFSFRKTFMIEFSFFLINKELQLRGDVDRKQLKVQQESYQKEFEFLDASKVISEPHFLN